MLKTFVAGVVAALALSAAGAAQAQSTYMKDWNLAEMKAILVAGGYTITSEDNTAEPFIAAKTAEGLKFSVTGNACEGAAGAKRCRGAYLQASFTMDTDAQVDAAVKRLGTKYWLALSNDEKALMVSRYVIFDYGIHKDNVLLNITLFTGLSEEIWDTLY